MAMGNVETQLKRCNRCKKWKARSGFSRNRRQKDGLKSYCKQCDRDYRCKIFGKGGVLRKYFTYEERHRVVDGVKQKRCRRCKTWKAESEFYKKQKHKDGLAIWCKKCADKASIKSRKKRLAIEKRAEG
jgi:hypothetical protein